MPLDSPPSSARRPCLAHVTRLALVVLAAGVLFGDLVQQPGGVLYSNHSDLIVLHIPRKTLSVSSFQQTGELPLWNPYEFCGAPLVHDPQVATFYPPHWVLYALPPAAIPAALSWLVVAHVVAAGWCMYLFAVGERLSPDGALVAALGYMFAGKWLLHLLAAGHYVLVGLAWLPLLLWLMSRAIRRRHAASAVAAGVVLCPIILGTHPQWTFYAGLLAAAWTLLVALQQRREVTSSGGEAPSLRGALAWWLAVGAVTVLGGVALSAVQLLPTYEAMQFSVRGHEGIEQVGGWKLALGTVGQLIGPGVYDPREVTPYWEMRGNLGILWVVPLVLAVVLADRPMRGWLALTLGFFLFSAGGSDLLQSIVPGIRLFRLPCRMLIVVALPMSLLAGAATSRLFAGGLSAPQRKLAAAAVLSALAVALLLVSLDFVINRPRAERFVLHAYWRYAPPLLVVLVGWLLLRPRPESFVWRTGWIGLLLADLLLLNMPLVAVRRPDDVLAPPACVQWLVQNTPQYQRVFDRDFPGEASQATSPLGPSQAILQRLHTIRGYNPLDVRHYRRFLDLVAGKGDRPLELQLGFGSIPIVHKPMLDMVGLRYLMQPDRLRYHPDKEPDVSRDPRWKRVYRDPRPQAYVFTGSGLVQVPPHVIYENIEPLPRAFVVPQAGLLPESNAAATMAANDFRRRVLLEDHSAVAAGVPAADGTLRAARIRSYQPNRVTLEIDAGPAGWLVLSDVWFPGWKAWVDGEPAPIHRANVAFRAVALPEGAREVRFEFAPESYRLGKQISGAAVALLGAALLAALVWDRRRYRSAAVAKGDPANHGSASFSG